MCPPKDLFAKMRIEDLLGQFRLIDRFTYTTQQTGKCTALVTLIRVHLPGDDPEEKLPPEFVHRVQDRMRAFLEGSPISVTFAPATTSTEVALVHEMNEKARHPRTVTH